jgi:hypothetical protein
MSDDTPTDRVVIAVVERVAMAVEWTIRSSVRLKKVLKTAVQWTAQRLTNPSGR